MNRKFFILACAAAALVACEKGNPEPAPVTGELSCTMAIYGSGGYGKNKQCDVDHVNELIDAMYYGPTEKVNVIAQYNFASNASDLTYVNGTAVMCLKARNKDIVKIDDTMYEGKGCKSLADSDAVRMKAVDAKLRELVEAGAYSFRKIDGANKVKMYRPSDISGFLDRCASEFPADHYLFCLSGHGGAWDAYDDREITKATAFDDNFRDESEYSIGITAKNLASGISGSRIAGKIPVVYFNSCEMNFLENLCEYAACPVTYALISFLETNGTFNDVILKELNKAEGNGVSDLTSALLTAFEVVYEEKECDISLINLQSMKSAAAGVKNLVPLFKTAYQNDENHFNDLIFGLNCPNPKEVACTKDFSQFLDLLSRDENLDKNARTIAGTVLASIKASIVKTIYGGECRVKKDLLTGANFLGKDAYSKSRQDNAESYDNNAFYKLTDWNTLFEVFDDKINRKK